MTECLPCVEVPVWSLHDEACREADIFKWLESERRRYDVGCWAHQEWIRLHWTDFLRGRWLQHLFGQRRYAEFDDDSFGRLADGCDVDDEAIQFVVERFMHDRWENLNFFWHCESAGCTSGELMQLLDVIGINHLRTIDPPNALLASLVGAA